MITLSGTVRNSVQLAALDSKWQQKRNSGNILKNDGEMTEEERELQSYQKQADDIRTGNRTAELTSKLMSGLALTAEEKAFIAQHNPTALKDYEELKRKQDAYKQELKNCKSKEDVEKVKMSHMGNFMAQVKEIANNPNIPKDKKIELMNKLSKEVTGIEEAHEEFTESQYYLNLPDKTEVEHSEEVSITVTEENGEVVILSETTEKSDDTDDSMVDAFTTNAALSSDEKEVTVKEDKNQAKGSRIDICL